MSDPSIAFQTAIYTQLNAQLSIPVYDSVPQSATYPYVTIEYQESARSNWLSDRKDQKIMYFSIWSDYRGQKEVLQIMSELDGLLHNQRFTLTTGRIAEMQVLSKRTNREPDGVTFMGQLRLQILLEY
tara:strand:+ start:7466 stop:7849 length:384 start_codon:yes stop_codon:yes gene_type:complete